ncbi:hypothetical protein [Alkalitalea saponilacus]|uniref:HEPN domain-containing protein n=1 Tax=Alkalitalea saponilacus TaxID=889453 RepID=A0A1T5GPU9_9BACT|nr:hypothetical protein [Alkalitalea saponilacus]ASB48235.1 hypothetical protein CDL62_03300 [Alkalitalea saponilacus]SKC10350.1 hypothetical protein SAMN03080601_01910 [Alkalitalea saponilacus]
METTTITADQDFQILANDTLKEANRFYAIIEKALNGSSKFSDDLKYSMILMTLEKYFVALMACYEELPTHHVPLGLFREAEMLEPDLTPSMKQTCVLTGKFEGICSLEDFGYRTPSPEDLSAMLEGMAEIKSLTERRVLG